MPDGALGLRSSGRGHRHWRYFDASLEDSWSTMAADPILAVKPLGFPWETADPFLLCVHHDDAYPQGNETMGPAGSLAGRALGQDFAGKDGWRTAGRGIVHAEMFPLGDRERPNPLELFQIWLNLPATAKMAEPHFRMLWSDDVPRQTFADAQGGETEVVAIAGRIGAISAPPPPPESWAAQPDHDLAILTLRMTPRARWTL